MATVRDVAALAGVSITSVSRIMSGDPTYKATELTRKKVWNAAIKLNYWPNTPRLSKSTSSTAAFKIGCILSVAVEKYSDPFFLSVLSGAESRFNQDNVSISVIKTYSELQDQTVFFNTFNEPLSGILLLDEIPKDMLQYIQDRVPHIVGVDTYYESIDNVGFDRTAAAIKAVSYLIERGHKRIGFIGGSAPNLNLDHSRRFLGYCESLRKAGLPINYDLVKDCKWSLELARTYADELLSLEAPPTAIFAASDLIAIAALSAIYQRNFKVPTDIAIIGISNIDITSYTSPPLTTLDVHPKEIGYAAADLLLARLNGDVSMKKSIYLPVNIVVRGSV